MRLTAQELTDRLKHYKPQTVAEVLEMTGVTLRFIDCGQFRCAYRVVGTHLVLKVPHAETPTQPLRRNIRHARQEAATLARVLASTRKYVAVQPYMPAVYFFSRASGITLMQHYRRVPSRGHKAEVKLILQEAIRISGHNAHDIASGADGIGHNLGMDRWGNIKIIDLGWFLEGSE